MVEWIYKKKKPVKRSYGNANIINDSDSDEEENKRILLSDISSDEWSNIRVQIIISYFTNCEVNLVIVILKL